ncbi:MULTISPECIES: DUF2922 domain-containing protein [Lactobacillaceae]|uniref:DUF2922 domain-containing protein n=1 Tax=Lactobacillaceae TaxID=33958 RepID=UPI0014579339|nr:DUF2922 domain-containing protein [Lactobacillus sp. HBUAS51381]NLR10653.1 DUF2922 domain-containing protein [Lactobacillus sp. HBUAS51381]
MKTLELSFKGSDKRVKHLRLKYVNADLTPAEVEGLMKQVAAAKLFAKGDVDLYADPLRAEIVETTKTALVGGPQPAPAV